MLPRPSAPPSNPVREFFGLDSDLDPNTPLGQFFGPQAAANQAVARSPIPRDINSRERAIAGAKAASPAPYTPEWESMRRANNAFWGISDNDTKDLFSFLPAASRPAPAPPTGGMGKTLSDAQGDAIFGPRTVTPGANPYGTASVRYAQPGELPKPAVQTHTGVTREGPFDRQAALNALQPRHPGFWNAGSPENLAFLAYAKQHGQEAAFANADKIAASVAQQKARQTAATQRHQQVQQAAEQARPKSGIEQVRQKFEEYKDSPVSPWSIFEQGRDYVAGPVADFFFGPQSTPAEPDTPAQAERRRKQSQ